MSGPVSIMFLEQRSGGRASAPYDSAVIKDLHIDEIVGRVTKDRERYKLDEYYAQKPVRRADVEFRLQVAGELDGENRYEEMLRFLQDCALMRRALGFCGQGGDPAAADKWRFDAAAAHHRAVERLDRALDGAGSRGLVRVREWLDSYRASEAYRRLSLDIGRVNEIVGGIRYCVKLDVGAERIEMCGDSEDHDYIAGLARAFSKYDLGGIGEITAFADIRMCDLELRMLGILKGRYPEAFAALHEFCAAHPISSFENTFAAFERELQFYMTYLKYARERRREGRVFCLPQFSDRREIDIRSGYDLALAQRDAGTAVVPNDMVLGVGERHAVLTGPNQGGKTTFARMFGQVMYFASLGLPVPCASARVFFPESVHTHFPVEEDMSSGMGRLKEELSRLAPILDGAAEGGIVILNELFASTTGNDALVMGRRVLGALAERGCTCLYVTHIHELAAGDSGVVSLAAINDLKGGRTFRIARQAADSRALAAQIIEKYRVSKAEIKERGHAAITANGE